MCILFPDIPGGAKKIVYRPVVDKFEVLQLKGFYNLISNDSTPFNPIMPKLTEERRIFVMAEKNISRPIVRNHTIISLFNRPYSNKVNRHYSLISESLWTMETLQI